MPGKASYSRMPRDARRRQLLDTAWRIVGTDGADALTLGLLAVRADLTKPVTYDHIGDRQGLLIAFYQDFDARQTAALDAALSAGEATPEARAGIIAEAYVDCVLTQGCEMPSVLGALAGSPALEAVKLDYQRAFIAKCRALLTPDAEDGTVTNARYWAMVGAADALSDAAAGGRIDAATAKAELRDTIEALVERSRTAS